MYGYSSQSSGGSSSGMLYGGPLGAYLSGIGSNASSSSGSGNISSGYGNSSNYGSSYNSSPFAMGAGSGSSANSALRRSTSTRRNIPPTAASSSLYGTSSLVGTSSYASPTARQYTNAMPSSNISSSSSSASNAYFTPQMIRRGNNPSDSSSTQSNNLTSSYTPSTASSAGRYRPGSFKSTRQSESPSSYANNGYESYRQHHSSPSNSTYKTATPTYVNNSNTSFTSTARISPSRPQQTSVIYEPPSSSVAVAVSLSPSPLLGKTGEVVSAPSAVITTESRPTSRTTNYVPRSSSSSSAMNYKELYESECRKNELVRGEIEVVEKEINELKNASSTPPVRSSRRQELELRRLERKEAEYDELLKKIGLELAENEKLKAENSALEKVVNSLKISR